MTVFENGLVVDCYYNATTDQTFIRVKNRNVYKIRGYDADFHIQASKTDRENYGLVMTNFDGWELIEKGQNY